MENLPPPQTFLNQWKTCFETRIAEPEITHSLRELFKYFKYSFTPQGGYVGEIQENWRFPSDHLPIGMSLDGLNFASWNVLNPVYMEWVSKNSQGLSRSLIAEEHQPLPGTKITVREHRLINSLFEMTQRQSLISLQECGNEFLEELEKQLPAPWKLVREKEGDVKNQNAVLYNSHVLELKENHCAKEIFSIDRSSERVQDVLFQRVGKKDLLRIINVHLPGAPGNPAPKEFAEYLAQTDLPEVATIAMGDMNFNEFEMKKGLQAGYQKNPPYHLFAPYCTNISPYSFQAKAIDHFLVKAPHFVILQKPDELLSGLQSTVDLLQNTRRESK